METRLRIELINREVNAFVDSIKRFFVAAPLTSEENITITTTAIADDKPMSATMAARTKKPTTFAWLKGGELAELTLLQENAIYGKVLCMRIARGQLWCLMEDHIQIRSLDHGQILKRIPNIHNGKNMVVYRDEYVGVLASSTVMIFDLDGNYRSKLNFKYGYPNLIFASDELFFALKEESSLSNGKRGTIYSYLIENGTAYKHLSREVRLVDGSHLDTAVWTKTGGLFASAKTYKLYSSAGKQIHHLKPDSSIVEKYQCGNLLDAKVCDTDGIEPLFFIKTETSVCVSFSANAYMAINLPAYEIQDLMWVTCDNANQKIYVAVSGTLLKPGLIKVFGL